MSILVLDASPIAQDVKCTENDLIVSLIDGRTISVPLVWFPYLACATKEQLNNWEIMGNGEGIHWPDIDEDISVNGLLKGIRPQQKPNKGMEPTR